MPDLDISKIEYLSELACKFENEYDISVDNIAYKGKKVIVIKSGDKLISIKREDLKETYLIFLTGVYEYIKNRNFKNILKLYNIKSGKPYMRFNDELYLISDYIGAYKPKLSLQQNIVDVIKLTAQFHKSAKGYIPPAGGKTKSGWGRWIEEYKKQYSELKNLREIIELKHQKTPFECEFICSGNEYINRMEQCIYILKNKGYLDIVQESMKGRQVCIINLKQSNFYYNKGDLCIKSLNKCRYDVVEEDIANLLKRAVKDSHVNISGKAEKLISAYNNENRLLSGSTDIVAAFLMFPEQYIKILMKYYSKKDKWTEEQAIIKLNEAENLEERKFELAKALNKIKL